MKNKKEGIDVEEIENSVSEGSKEPAKEGEIKIQEPEIQEMPAPESEEIDEKKEKKARKPKKQKNTMVNYEKSEVEKLIVKLAQSGKTKSEIGLAMRDQYGIPDVKAFGISVGKVMKKEHIDKEIPEDLLNLIKKTVIMHNHLERSKKDRKGVHTLQLIESRVRKLGRYYSKIGKLPKNWKYDINKAKLIIKG